MLDPRRITETILGPVHWQDEVGGYCRCPGADLHTSAAGPKDCRVRIDGAPTIFCFHASCAQKVQEANTTLRRQLAAEPWQLALPGGRVLRSGDPLPPPPQARTPTACARTPDEQALLGAIEEAAADQRTRLLSQYHWPYDKILEDSPLAADARDPEDQFRLWLTLWPPDSTLWIGDVFDSGKPEHASHFRTVADWSQIGPCMGNFTCPSAFRSGCHSRADDNVARRHFLVVESDTLSRDEIGAVFAHLRRRLHYRLHCIIDTAGKSLHAWFSPPQTPVREARLKAWLKGLGCDPKMFGHSQPARVPGAFRDGRLQKLIWLREL
ncbi:MAG TPA: hypothetical protein VIU40_13020 [Geobacteraceae bacterium]